MLQKLKLIRMVFIVAKMFMVDFYKESKKELEDSTLYPQENYNTCKDRARNILYTSLERALNYYAYAIADHRETSHNENYSEEKQELEAELTETEVTSATRGWWLG